MTRFRILLTGGAVLALASCGTPVRETVAGASPAGAVWVLAEINDRPVTARTTLEFTADGSLQGQGPCNGYGADQRVPLPWFDAGRITTTRRTCPDQDEEDRFLRTLDDMVFAEITGDTMLLTGDRGDSLLFRLE